MKRSKLAVFLSIMGALALIVAACAPAATPTPTATPTPPPLVATPTPAPEAATPTPVPGVATPTPAAVATPTLVAGMPVGYGFSAFGEWGMPLNMPPPVYGGIFRYGAGSAPQHFDSHRTYNTSTYYNNSQVFDSLVRFSPYLDVALIPTTYEVEHVAPNLAEKWEVSKDGLVVTFYLKRGVKWHDGKPFTARDVKHNFDKIADPTKSVWTAEGGMWERVEVVDDYTVKVYLKYPTSDLLLITLAQSHFGIQPEHLKEVSYRDTAFLVGTGPFRLKSYSPGIRAEFDKNADYHQKGRPYFDGLNQYHGTNDVMVQRLSAGQLDYFRGGGEEQYAAVIKRVAPEVILRYLKQFGATHNLWVSYVKEGPWQDVRVRKAMAMVLDREALCKAEYGARADVLCNPRAGWFVSAPMGRGVPYGEYEKAWQLTAPIETRVKEAKRLLAEAGYPQGFKADFLASGSLAPLPLTLMDQLQRLLGLNLGTRQVPAGQLFDILSKGDFDLHQRGMVSFNGSMEQFISNTFIPGGSSNYGFYTHPKVEELYRDMLKEGDRGKKLEIAHQIERLLIQDVAYIPLANWSAAISYWPYIKPQIFEAPMWNATANGHFLAIWFDKNDPTWAKRAK